MKRPSKRLQILLAVALLLYACGYLTQFIGNYAVWQKNGGMLGSSSPPFPSLSPLACLKGILWFPYSLYCIAGCAAAVAAIFLYRKLFSQDALTDSERNFDFSAKGTYGTSGWMQPREVPAVLDMVSDLSKHTGTVLGMLDGRFLCIPEKTRMNGNLAVYGASGSMKTRSFCMNRILQSAARGESLIICDPKSELYEKSSEYMLETQKRVNSGELSSDALLAYSSLQQKYSVYQRVVQSNINYYLKENPGAWLVYETGYKKLFGFTGTGDVQDTLLAGLLCALCFSGLFAMERKGGMDEILACTPLGRKYTVKAKLRQSTAVAAVISFGTVLPHLWQVLRDYGLPSLLGPAMSISDLQAVPKFITLSDLLIFWLICRFAACLCMSRITLWLGQKLGNLLTALFISAVAYCLPALLSLSGMKNGIEWLGFYPLFHAAALWQNQGYNANGESYNAMWIPIFLVCAAFFLAWAIGQALIDDYDMIGVPDEVL